MAVVRSTIIVVSMVTTNFKIAPLNLPFKIKLIVTHSFMRHETTIKTPASAASGIWLITGASTNMASKMPSAWKMPVRRVTAPDFTATLVRAIAAVAGMPPKNGTMMLPIPCARSSRLLSSLAPVIREAVAPHNRLSIIASTAILTAGAKSPITVRKSSSEASSKRSSKISVAGMFPTTATSRFSAILAAVATIMANSEEGIYLLYRIGNSSIISITNRPMLTAVIFGSKPSCQ